MNMEYGIVIGVLHQVVGYLLYPVIIGLMGCVLVCLFEVGMSVFEAVHSLKRFVRVSHGEALTAFDKYASVRLERVDLLAKAGPILGLMGTLIPLGPGLIALGQGQLDVLSTALSVAFDTTVLGLLIGLGGFVMAKVRRRWYTQVWQQISDQSEQKHHG
ncbi:MotA/TolQ/ExbB proton channel family protein [Alteromonas sp. C1M14]|uniref:MotA/TolQ/ExbB proton channel family protein n=1 Tax=Alteromonas sp. C1M14 TaxID=2841567 RepID=UPI001C09AE27|nr:MotA/TolQ/ExbB proton channel family protein [Alteromonas sp. C1M14]MBU2979820.1 MotA/TolQ/ExbB proton channel family protein [Alteromonas sp. C1M14]